MRAITNFALCFCGVYLSIGACGSSASFASAPGRGTSMSPDHNYESIEQPLGIGDVLGRIDRRSLEVSKDEAKDLKTRDQKAAQFTKRSKDAAKSRKHARPIIVDHVSTSFSHQLDPGNLPAYYDGIDRSNIKASDGVVFVPINAQVHLSSIRKGDMFIAVVDQEIKASPSVPTPIRAMVVSENQKGAYFIGEASLDRELKRVFFNFSSLRLDSGAPYNVMAAGLSPKGSVGLEGEYHTQAGLFFVGELASATAAGVLDSTINRNQTTLGTYVQEPSLANSAKTGAVTALSHSADRLAEQSRQAPEYTDLPGYQQIKIFIKEDPVEIN